MLNSPRSIPESDLWLIGFQTTNHKPRIEMGYYYSLYRTGTYPEVKSIKMSAKWISRSMRNRSIPLEIFIKQLS